MIAYQDGYVKEDLPSLRRAVRELQAEGDVVGRLQLEEIIAGLQTERGVETPSPPIPEKEDELLFHFDPEQAMGELWEELNEESRRLLLLGHECIGKLGNSSKYATAIGIHIAVAFENEVRIRAEACYRRNTGARDAFVKLHDIVQYLYENKHVHPSLFVMARLRNRLVHAKPFNGAHFNAMIDQAGFGQRSRAFQSLAMLRL